MYVNFYEDFIMDFSVLMSVYIKEKPQYFKECLDSLLSQTVLPTQIVMVEDGPLTEELYSIIKEYKQKTDIIKSVPLKENVGLGKALSIGLAACDYSLVARMDTDDIAFPERFEYQLKAFEEDPELDICGTHALEFDGNTENIISKKTVPVTHEEIYEYAKKRNPFNHPTVMYKKKAVLDAGDYQHAMGFEDYFLWARMLVNGAKAKNIDEYLLYFRTGGDMFKRRGGYKYLKSALAVKKRIHKTGLNSFSDYFISSAVHIAVSLMPNKLRSFVYRKFLRKN